MEKEEGRWVIATPDLNSCSSLLRQIASIDVASKTFNIDPATPPTYTFLPKARWLAFNLLSELDAPGECV